MSRSIPPDDEPRLYGELARWFHLLTAPEDYAEEAAFYARVLRDRADGPVETVLELGSGGGNNASHLKDRFTLTLVDRSPAMLAVSRSLNAECEHVEGDMRSLRLERAFDAVFVHDAVAYIATERDLLRVFATAYAHCRPGGSAVFVPDHVSETFAPATRSGGHDTPDGARGLRYLEWVRGAATRTTYVVDFVYLLREDDRVRVEQDRHVCGLFPQAVWLRGLEAAGFETDVMEPPHDDSAGQVVFACRRPR